ncbi:S-layer homology domain-containing protein [Lyngbya aestuarii]|uniref:S-layer homology domain-containing protein n=1 Tax=Lyngbya aestuarii TaxID=118322 RepID=UPI00403E13D6
MIHRFIWSSLSPALLALVSTMGAAAYLSIGTKVSAQETFPDVEADYWASPFIQTLAGQDIVAGYPDGTFRPEQSLDRDEFAAMIRQAFEREQVKKIPSGSVFKDVPQNYWAAPPIEEAYETGFMRGFSENLFRPQEEVSKVQALVALTNGLNLTYNPTTSTTTQGTTTPGTTERAKKQRVTKNRLMFPLAATVLMQPILKTSSTTNIQRATAAVPAVTQSTSEASAPSALEYLQSYYKDAEMIPEYAIDNVAAATQANMVVNYPQPNILNPQQSLNRGAAAAIIYQGLVYRGDLEPLSSNAGASQYIVNR